MSDARRRSVDMERVEPRRLLSALADGPEFLVNAQTTGMEAYPSVAVGGDGNFVVGAVLAPATSIFGGSRGGATPRAHVIDELEKMHESLDI